jgi:hypothetical protein
MCDCCGKASVHVESAQAYEVVSQLRDRTPEEWLADALARRDRLLSDLVQFTRGAEGLRHFASLRMATLKLAERLHSAAAGDLDQIEQHLEDYDRESERLLAESDGLVKKERALLSHVTAPGPKPGLPHTAEDIEAIRERLRAAERENERRLTTRAQGRRKLSDVWQKAATTVLDASLRVLALSEPDRLALEAASAKANDIRAQLDELQRQIETREATRKS